MATKRKTRSRVATALKKYVRGNSKKNPRHVKGSTVSLRNFTGRVIRKRNGQVVILGRRKR